MTYKYVEHDGEATTIDALATNVQRAFVGLGIGWHIKDNPLTAHAEIVETIQSLIADLKENPTFTSVGTAGILVHRDGDEGNTFAYDVLIDIGYVLP